MRDNYYTLLFQVVQFILKNYEPFNGVTEDELALMLLPSYQNGTFFPVIAGSGSKGEILAFYEYFFATQEYINKLKANAGKDYLPPSNGERNGDILFCPIAVIHKDYRGKTLPLTRLALAKLQKEYPTHKGLYRWVLKEQRLHFIPFKGEGKEG